MKAAKLYTYKSFLEIMQQCKSDKLSFQTKNSGKTTGYKFRNSSVFTQHSRTNYGNKNSPAKCLTSSMTIPSPSISSIRNKKVSASKNNKSVIHFRGLMHIKEYYGSVWMLCIVLIFLFSFQLGDCEPYKLFLAFFCVCVYEYNTIFFLLENCAYVFFFLLLFIYVILFRGVVLDFHVPFYICASLFLLLLYAWHNPVR